MSFVKRKPLRQSQASRESAPGQAQARQGWPCGAGNQCKCRGLFLPEKSAFRKNMCKLMVFSAAALLACTRRRRAGHAFVGSRRVGHEWRRRSGHARSGPDQGSVALWVAPSLFAPVCEYRGSTKFAESIQRGLLMIACVSGSSTPARYGEAVTPYRAHGHGKSPGAGLAIPDGDQYGVHRATRQTR
jgi:hypothetical protein